MLHKVLHSVKDRNVFLLIPQSFDWLAAFHLDLLQAILFIAVYPSAAVFLANCFNYRSRGLPTALFSKYCSFKDVHYKLVMPNCMPYPRVASIFLFLFLKVFFLLSPFKKLHHSLFYLSILFSTFFSSTTFHMHL